MAKRKRIRNMTVEQFLVTGAGGQFGTTLQYKLPEDAAGRRHVRPSSQAPISS